MRQSSFQHRTSNNPQVGEIGGRTLPYLRVRGNARHGVCTALHGRGIHLNMGEVVSRPDYIRDPGNRDLRRGAFRVSNPRPLTWSPYNVTN
jgi:hypothetical protein